METVLFFFLTFCYLCLLIWGLFLTRKDGLWNLSNVLLFVIIGLIYDNVIIATGRFLGESNLLEALSYPRYWLHALFTPTLILFAWSICYRLNMNWAQKTSWKIIFFLLTLGLIFYELLTSIRGLELEPKWKNDVLTYESVSQSGSPIMVIMITILLGIIGFMLLRKYHYYWLFIGTLSMILGGVLVIWIKLYSFMNVLELVLIVSLLMTRRFQVRSNM